MIVKMRKKKFKLQRPKSTKKTPKDVPSTSAPPPPWTELPADLIANILHRLGAVEILERAEIVCKTWNTVCREPSMWRVIDMKNFFSNYDTVKFEAMCRHAVDRSKGELFQVNIEYLCTDDLIHYICERSPQLKHLQLSSCYHITGQGLSEAVKKIPELEELHLHLMSSSIRSEDMESIGRSCPMLKSFAFNKRADSFPFSEPVDPKNNEYALAIAKTMPNLRHLQIFGDEITNEWLQAILDNCPKLESLDLRKCFNLDLEGDLGKRLSNQIKNLRGPLDSTSDYEWDDDDYDSETFSGEYYGSDYYDDYSIGDYDDFTDPFNSAYYPDNGGWFFDDELDPMWEHVDGW